MPRSKSKPRPPSSKLSSNANVPVPRYLRFRGLNSITNVTVVCGKGAPTAHVFNAKSGSGMPLSHPPDSELIYAHDSHDSHYLTSARARSST